MQAVVNNFFEYSARPLGSRTDIPSSSRFPSKRCHAKRVSLLQKNVTDAKLESCLQLLTSLSADKFPDYKFTLVEADFLDVKEFETDLKDFFGAMQCRNDKRKLKELIKTERFRRMKEDTAWAVAMYLDRKWLTAKGEKEGLDVCKALEELLKDERMEGEREERISIIRNMVREGLDHEMIRKVTGCTAKEFSMAVE